MDLHFKSMGSGDPLIILHGFLGSLDNWQTIGRHLSEYYTVFLVDQRNHGKSPHFPEMDIPTLSDDLKSFLDQNWIFEHARIIGHSMGGKTAMHFALEHPDLVHKLVVVDIAPKTYLGGHEDILKALANVDLSVIEQRKDVQEKLEKSIHEEGTIQFLMKNLSRAKEGHFEWKMNLPVLVESYDDISKSIDFPGQFFKPALFIRGGESRYILDEDLPMIRKQFPLAEFETIPGAGHWVHADKPELMLQALRLFLAD